MQWRGLLVHQSRLHDTRLRVCVNVWMRVRANKYVMAFRLSRYAIRPVVMRCCTRSDIVLIHAHDRMRLPFQFMEIITFGQLILIKTTPFESCKQLNGVKEPNIHCECVCWRSMERARKFIINTCIFWADEAEYRKGRKKLLRKSNITKQNITQMSSYDKKKHTQRDGEAQKTNNSCN